MNNYQDIQKQLFNAILARIEGDGFRFVSSRNIFYKSISVGLIKLHITIIRHSADFDLTVAVGVRHDNVEVYMNKGRANLSSADKKRICTVACELGYMTSQYQHRWKITDYDDIAGVADSIVEKYHSVGLPYIENYVDLTNVLRMLMDSNEGKYNLAPDLLMVVRSVVIAYIIRGLDEAKNVLERQHVLLKNRNSVISENEIAELIKTIGLESVLS